MDDSSDSSGFLTSIRTSILTDWGQGAARAGAPSITSARVITFSTEIAAEEGRLPSRYSWRMTDPTRGSCTAPWPSKAPVTPPRPRLAWRQIK